MAQTTQTFTIDLPQLPTGLSQKICSEISKRSHRNAVINFCSLLLVSIFSFFSTTVFFINLLRSINTSGFYDYLSIVISDAGTIGSFWKQLLASLAQSLPALSLLTFLGALCILLWIGAKTFKSASILKII